MRRTSARHSGLVALTIRLQRTNGWQPVQASQLMQSLFAWPVVVKIAIEAGYERIQWQIVAPVAIVSGIEKSIYALFPTASISRKRPEKIRVREYLYLFELAGHYVQPLNFAEDFKGSDPLAMLVQSIGDLRPDELVTYELTLNSADSHDFKKGRKQLTTSNIKWWDFVFPDTAMGAVVDKAMGWDQVARYRPQLQRMAELKLNSLLKKVTLGLRVPLQLPGTGQLPGDTFSPNTSSFWPRWI